MSSRSRSMAVQTLGCTVESSVGLSAKLMIGFLPLLILSADSMESSLQSVCPGGRLALTCNATDTMRPFLKWIVTHLGEHYSKHVTAVSPHSDPLYISEILFNITRVSNHGATPLLSTLLIANVTVALNGTTVECTYNVEGSANVSRTEMFSKTINVISTEERAPHPQRPVVNRTEMFEEDGIRVLLEWVAETGTGVAYDVSIIPQVPIIRSLLDTSVEVRVSYNTIYNMNISATLCGQNSATTAAVIHFVICTNPYLGAMRESSVELNADSGGGESSYFTAGTIVTFTCPNGLVLTGPNMSTCMGNGEWEPAIQYPTELNCKANCGVPSLRSDVNLMFNSTLEGSQLIFWCDKSPNETMIASCLTDGRWSEDLDDYSCVTVVYVNTSKELVIGLVIALVSSIILFTTFSLILGCIFGRLWQKRKQPTQTSDIKDGHLQSSQAAHGSSSPDDIIAPTEQDLEMMENVAYGPLKCTAPK